VHPTRSPDEASFHGFKGTITGSRILRRGHGALAGEVLATLAADHGAMFSPGREFASNGLVPAALSCVFVAPSPSVSAFAASPLAPYTISQISSSPFPFESSARAMGAVQRAGSDG
jgi:hypothetical protein